MTSGRTSGGAFSAITDHLRPRAILFENVQRFTAAQDGAVLVALVDELKRRKYAVDAKVVEAWQFGVPQHRSRLFVVGTAPISSGPTPTFSSAARESSLIPSGV